MAQQVHHLRFASGLSLWGNREVNLTNWPVGVPAGIGIAPDTHHLDRRLPVVAWLRQICSRQAPDLQALQVAAGCEADNGILNISGGNDDVFLSYG